jgi:hypothetical protein
MQFRILSSSCYVFTIHLFSWNLQYIQAFLARLQNCENWLLALSCLSFRMEQVGYHWTDFYEYLKFEDFSKFYGENSFY